MSELSTYRILITELQDARPGYRDRFKMQIVTPFGVTDVLTEGSWRVVQSALEAHVKDLEFRAPQFP